MKSLIFCLHSGGLSNTSLVVKIFDSILCVSLQIPYSGILAQLVIADKGPSIALLKDESKRIVPGIVQSKKIVSLLSPPFTFQNYTSSLSVHSNRWTCWCVSKFDPHYAHLRHSIYFPHLKPYMLQVLHGDISQHQRDLTINQFRKKQFQVLIATDVAARGIDVSDIDLVVQYRPPNDSGE